MSADSHERSLLVELIFVAVSVGLFEEVSLVESALRTNTTMAAAADSVKIATKTRDFIRNFKVCKIQRSNTFLTTRIRSECCQPPFRDFRKNDTLA